MILPRIEVDPRRRIEGGDERIGDLAVSFRMAVLACELEPDLAKSMRK